jgi:aspartate aminotransferase-like enzyme
MRRFSLRGGRFWQAIYRKSYVDQVRKIYTPGPVTIAEHILDIGAKQPPYNRTDEFSQLTLEVLSSLKYIFQTNGEVALLTGSGTLAMEAAVLNFLTPSDHVIVINGGTFGKRWCDLCKIHAIPFREIKLEAGDDLDLDQLRNVCREDTYSAFLINAHETSTGQLYDIQAIGEVARDFGLFFIVDAISSICADPFQMDDWNVDVTILSSQKAIALPPGLSFVAMGTRARARLREITPKSLYLNLQDYLTNQERGQVPYTPAIGLLLQLHQRLQDIQQFTLPGIIAQHAQRSSDFRKAIIDLPFSILPARQSNAMTALICMDMDAVQIVHHLQTQHAVEVAPSGGALRTRLIRISHMGVQNSADTALIVAALADVIHPHVVERSS